MTSRRHGETDLTEHSPKTRKGRRDQTPLERVIRHLSRASEICLQDDPSDRFPTALAKPLGALIFAARRRDYQYLKDLTETAGKYIDMVLAAESQWIVTRRREKAASHGEKLVGEFFERAHAKLVTRDDEAEYLCGRAERAIHIIRAGVSMRRQFACEDDPTGKLTIRKKKELLKEENRKIAEFVESNLNSAVAECHNLRVLGAKPGSKSRRSQEPKRDRRENARKRIANKLGRFKPKSYQTEPAASEAEAVSIVRIYLGALGFGRIDNIAKFRK